MAYYDPREGIILSDDDRKELNHKGRGRIAESIINKIIWGNEQHFYNQDEIKIYE